MAVEEDCTLFIRWTVKKLNSVDAVQTSGKLEKYSMKFLITFLLKEN